MTPWQRTLAQLVDSGRRVAEATPSEPDEQAASVAPATSATAAAAARRGLGADPGMATAPPIRVLRRSPAHGIEPARRRIPGRLVERGSVSRPGLAPGA